MRATAAVLTASLLLSLFDPLVAQAWQVRGGGGARTFVVPHGGSGGYRSLVADGGRFRDRPWWRAPGCCPVPAGWRPIDRHWKARQKSAGQHTSEHVKSWRYASL